MKTTYASISALSLVFAMSAIPAFSAGSDSTEPPKATNTTVVCEEGMIWDEELQECVVPEESSMNDDQIYNSAREFAYAGQYDNAIRVLNLAANPHDPRILNYLGFANRKAGRMEIGMEFYRQALDAKPDYILARSYMGQALIQQGDIKAAQEQLAMIESYGGRDTWAYRALELALDGEESTY